MSRIIQSRRRFLWNVAGVSAGVAGFPYVVPSTVFGAAAPSERIVLGCIGVGGQGTGNMQGFLGKNEQVRVVAVCDVDQRNAERAKARLADAAAWAHELRTA